jgi:hypothetical protein
VGGHRTGHVVVWLEATARMVLAVSTGGIQPRRNFVGSPPRCPFRLRQARPIVMQGRSHTQSVSVSCLSLFRESTTKGMEKISNIETSLVDYDLLDAGAALHEVVSL